VHFLDAWTKLRPFDLARLMLPAAILGISVFLPGRRIARWAAGAIALLVLGLPELGPLWPTRTLWAILWLAVAWRAGVEPVQHPGRPRPSGFESGAVGLLLAAALLGLLVAAVARQDLPARVGRPASYGLLLMCLGLLHLMLRRDVLRATLAFTALGLGLQVLDQAAPDTLLPGGARGQGLVVLATAIAAALPARLAEMRERDAGTAWVSDAHDLHD
jgi:hypothetical protein